MTTPSHDVDALREKLRALGYLDAGVTRFVLAPARADRGPWAIAWRASVRVGVLAAVLLGVAGTLALALRVPGLLTSARDAIVVALYVGVALGCAVALGVLAVALVATRLLPRVPAVARHGALLARFAGVLVGCALLVYLTRLWQVVGTSAPGRWWVLSALAVTVAVSLLLGHATSVTALALVARDRGALPGPGIGRHRIAWWAGLGAVAFAGAALLYAVTARPTEAMAPPPLVVVPTGLRMTVIAVDGFDVDFARAVADRGQAAGLHALLSARVGDVAATGDGDPVRVWTTVATGQPPSRHGVEGLETRRVAGVEGRLRLGSSPLATALATVTDLVRLTRPTVASGRDRTERTFWEVAALAGLRTLTVNWWVTWPADARDGAVISDRALLRLQRGGTLDREVAPPELFDRLRGRWAEIQRTADDVMASAWPAGIPARERPDAVALAREALRLDALQVELLDQAGVGDADLLTIYLPGLDIAQHALFGEPTTLAPSLIEARRNALEHAYVTLGRLIAPLLEGPDRTVVVVALPGRLGTASRGLLAARGPGVLGSLGESPVRPEDVAPTILFGLGVPISREAAGRPRVGLFDEAIATRAPLRWVDTWGRRSVEPGASTPLALDDEVRERLKSLGYVQ